MMNEYRTTRYGKLGYGQGIWQEFGLMVHLSDRCIRL